jgi:glutamine amidotransferase of anthranilate synthase or aminodeoxychorismate synthase
MFVLIDNFDSFTYNLVRYFEELGEEIRVYRADEIDLEEIYKLTPLGIVISPGPKSPNEAKESLDIIKEFCEKLPVLGVCLGHQCIGNLYGGNIIKGKEPVHGKLSMIKHSGTGIFKNIEDQFMVTRYHSLIIEKETLPKVLKVTATTEDGVIMGIEHINYPIYGVQFHPEAELTEFGHELLKNFIDICKERGNNR